MAEEEFDYYEVLELNRSASSSEIKKNYRKLALRWHPDKNPERKEHAEIQFKRVAEAYQVLSDTEKKQVYDRYGREGLLNSASPAGSRGARSSGFGGGFADPFAGLGMFGRNFGGGFGRSPFDAFFFRDPFDLFRDFFGDSDPFADFFDDDPFMNSSRSAFGRSAAPFGAFSIMDAFPTSPFHMIGMGPAMGGGGMMQQFSSFGGSGMGGSCQSTMTSYANINGKSIATTKSVVDGVETVVIQENGRTIKKTVNGVEQRLEQALEGGRRGTNALPPSGSRRSHQRHQTHHHSPQHHATSRQHHQMDMSSRAGKSSPTPNRRREQHHHRGHASHHQRHAQQAEVADDIEYLGSYPQHSHRVQHSHRARR